MGSDRCEFVLPPRNIGPSDAPSLNLSLKPEIPRQLLMNGHGKVPLQGIKRQGHAPLHVSIEFRPSPVH